MGGGGSKQEQRQLKKIIKTQNEGVEKDPMGEKSKKG